MDRKRTLELLSKFLVYEGRLPSNLVRFVRSHLMLMDAVEKARTAVTRWALLRPDQFSAEKPEVLEPSQGCPPIRPDQGS
jgi:hypothetical protein